MNFRMTDLQCAVALGQLENLREEIHERKKRIKTINNILSKIEDYYTIYRNPKNFESTFTPFRYVMIFNKENQKIKFSKCLEDVGVAVRNGFWPIHKQKVFKKFSKNINYENSNFLGKNTILLPVHKQVDKNLNLLKRAVKIYQKL